MDLGRGDTKIKKMYPDLPYEPITKDRYEELMGQIKKWPEKIERDVKGLEILNNEECEGGHCPIK